MARKKTPDPATLSAKDVFAWPHAMGRLVWQALKHLAKIRQFAAELGLSPSARTRIHAQPAEKQSPTEAFLYGAEENA